MYKKSLFGFSLLALATSGHTMSFNTPISKLNLPVMLSTEPPPPVKYFPPSTINVSAVRTCGDGDVVHFAENHQNFEYVPSDAPDFDVIMGYWIVEDNATNIMPTKENWYPVAYKKVQIATSEANRIYEGHFHPINHASTPNSLNVMGLIKPELLHLYELSRESFERTKKYRVFSAAFGCANPNGAEDLVQGKAFAPSPVQILRSLEKLKVEVDNFNLDNITSNDIKIKITIKSPQDSQLFNDSVLPSPFSYELSNSGVDLPQPAYGMFKRILDATYPADGEDYLLTMKSRDFNSDLDNFIGADKIAYCNAMGLSSDKLQKTYDNLEAFPMNLSCKNLFDGNGLQDKYNALFSTVRPTPDNFKKAKKDLARLFLMGAAFTAVQNELNQTTSRSTAGCHPKNGQYFVERLNSFPFKLSKPNGSAIYKFEASGSVQHPEFLFAINQYTRYYSHDVLGIWGQVTNVLQAPTSPAVYRDGQSMLLPNQPTPDRELTSESFSGSPININFKTKSVGGGCVGIPTC